MIVGRIVGDLHVGTPNREVLRVVREKLSRAAFTRAHFWTRQAIYREALREHRANRKLYRQVMSGRFT